MPEYKRYITHRRTIVLIENEFRIAHCVEMLNCQIMTQHYYVHSHFLNTFTRKKNVLAIKILSILYTVYIVRYVFSKIA